LKIEVSDFMALLEITIVEEAKNQLEGLIKPFQQEQNQRQKKSDFVKKCIQCLEKDDFFQLDELLKSKLAIDIREDINFKGCETIFSQLQTYANEQIENYQLQFKEGLLQMAEKAGMRMEVDLPRFSLLKGIEGKIDFTKRNTTINQTVIKSIDPKRIVSSALSIKRKLYDSQFEPKKFINSLFECYKAILKKSNQRWGDSIPIWQLYTDYVWSLQSKTFFQNMDKGKFKGYSVEQFAVDLWRFFESDISATEDGNRIKLNPGRGGSLWLIDQSGERRQITHASFIKN
jgi:hypothetical protein